MITKHIEPRMHINNGIKTFDIVQLTKFGTRIVSRATLASGLTMIQAVAFAEGLQARVSSYQGLKGGI